MKTYRLARELFCIAALVITGACPSDSDKHRDAFGDVGDGLQHGEQPVTDVFGLVQGVGSSGELTPLAGVEVSLKEVGVTLATDERGEFTISSLSWRSHFTFEIHAAGYIEAYRVAKAAKDAPTYLAVSLKQLASPQRVTLPALGGQPVTVTVGAADLTLEAGDLAHADGTPVTGEVELDIVSYDPDLDWQWLPTTQLADVGASDLINLRPYSIVRITATQAGEPINVARGQAVEWRSRLSAQMQQKSREVPATLWWLDPERGVWVPKDQTPLSADGGSLEVALAHFSFWGTAVDMTCGASDWLSPLTSSVIRCACVRIRAIDRLGRPVEGASVTPTDGSSSDSANPCFLTVCPLTADSQSFTADVKLKVDGAWTSQRVTASGTCRPTICDDRCAQRSVLFGPDCLQTGARCDTATVANACCAPASCDKGGNSPSNTCCLPVGSGCSQSNQGDSQSDECCGASVCGASARCCLPLHTTCANTSECCGATECQGGQCCAPAGSSCSTAADCCDALICDGGLCKIAPTDPCDPSHGEQCATGFTCDEATANPSPTEPQRCCQEDLASTCDPALDHDDQCCGRMTCERMGTTGANGQAPYGCCIAIGDLCGDTSECCSASGTVECRDATCVTCQSKDEACVSDFDCCAGDATMKCNTDRKCVARQ